MTREKAIEAMDVLVAEGYSVSLRAAVMERMNPRVHHSVEVLALGFDSVVLRDLCDLAEKLELRAHWSTHGGFTLHEPDRPAVAA